MLEKKRQKKFNQWATDKGWLARKIRYEGRNGCPDCIYVKQGLVVFIEWKKPGGSLQESQRQELPLLDDQLTIVGVFDDPEKAKEWINAIDAKRHGAVSDQWRQIFAETKAMRAVDATGSR